MQNSLIAILQQLRQHLLAAMADVFRRYPLGKTLPGVEVGQPGQATARIIAHGDGCKAPAADGGANQGTRAWRRRQEVAEHRLIQAVDAQRLGATSRPGNDVHVGGPQAMLT